MLPQNKPDRIRILFDDHRLVANAGLLLPATLARHLGVCPRIRSWRRKPPRNNLLTVIWTLSWRN